MSTPRRSDRKRTASTFFTDTSSLTSTPKSSKKRKSTPASTGQKKSTTRAKARAMGSAEVVSAQPPLSPLDGFFEALNSRQNFIARQNFACCRTCGIAEMNELRRGPLRNARAFVFYHMQDTGRAALTGNLMLRWAPFDEDEFSWERVSDVILEEAERFGLDVSWNGSIERCIELVELDVEPFRRMEEEMDNEAIDIDP